LRGFTSKSDTIYYKYSDKCTKIGVNVEICLDNN